MDEVFVAIEDYPNYLISNYGTVLNVKFNRELIPTWDKRDLRRKVTLYSGGVGKEFYIHRLVAKAFFINYRNECAVEFLNGDPQDCSVLNLTIGIENRGGNGLDAS